MTTGKYPFEGDNVYRLLEAIGRGEPAPPPTTLGPTLGSLLTHMLKRDPDLRPTVHEIKRHSYVYLLSLLHFFFKNSLILESLKRYVDVFSFVIQIMNILNR